MIAAFRQIGEYGIFEFDVDKTSQEIANEMQAQGYRAATESDLDAFLAGNNQEIDEVPLIGVNSSATRSDGVTGKKCLVDIDGKIKTNYWYTNVLFMDNKYLGVLN